MTSDEINVEAGLKRDHEHRTWLAVLRYSLAALTVVIAAAGTCVATRPPEPPEPICSDHPECSEWRATAQECQRWTP